MRIFKLTLKSLLALLVLLLVLLAIYIWRSFPSLDGELKAAGLAAPVQVRRDASDVTHIEAQSVTDAYFALGWVHAQERGWQLEFNRRVMHGQLSEAFGPAALETDKLIRTFGIVQAAQAQWQKMPPDGKALLEAYARGINAFHASSSQALPPEFHILGIKPGEWQPQDSLGWSLMMALDLGGNWGQEFARLSALQDITTQQLWQLLPPYPGEAPATAVDLAALYRGLGVYQARGESPKTAAAEVPGESSVLAMKDLTDINAWAHGLGHLEGVGSNDWVVSGTHTQSGKPLLANDPHLALGAPAIWYFARLKAPAANGQKALDVIGATLPGAPSVVLGRTAGVAWGFTNTGPDTQDLYLEQINPADAKQYKTPDGWATFTTREEVFKVKGRPDEHFVVRGTRHGPVLTDAQAAQGKVIDTKRFVLALRWGALDDDNQTALASFNANFAQTVDELLAAYEPYHSPMQNMVAADTRGRTAYRALGRVPVRRADNDLHGIAPAPGWDARYDWAGWIPADKTPRVEDAAIAAHGWHATANQRIAPADYPFYLGSDWITPERFDRIESLLGARPKHTLETLHDVQADQFSLATLKLLPVLLATKSDHMLAATALAQFKAFDGVMRADSPAPLIFAVWADELTRGLVESRFGAPKFNNLYGKRTFRSGLEKMMLDPQAGAFWCGKAGCAQQSAQALSRALDRIAAWQGADVASWRWGAAHMAISSHRPFSNVPALAELFEVRVPTGGDPWTVNVGQYWANLPDKPFANRHAASMRALYDLADPEKSRFIYQTGQSGLVFSSRYRDMRDQWAAVQYRPLQLQPDHWEHQATLVP
jgi:penicillin G amidase